MYRFNGLGGVGGLPLPLNKKPVNHGISLSAGLLSQDSTTITATATSSADLSAGWFVAGIGVFDEGGTDPGYVWSESTSGAVSSQSIVITKADYVIGAASIVNFRIGYCQDSVFNPATVVWSAVAPIVQSAAISGTATSGQTLTASHGVIAGSITQAVTYQWQHAEGGAYANIGGATASTFVLTDTQVGSTIKVVVTSTNSAGTGSATSSATSAVASASFRYGFNFRSTSGYVSDAAGDIYVLETDTYPTTRGGVTFGFTDQAGGSPLCIDRDAGISPKLAGIAYQPLGGATTRHFRIDKTAAAMKFRNALGDTFQHSGLWCAFYDAAVLKLRIPSTGTLAMSAASRWFDATEVERTAAAFEGSNVQSGSYAVGSYVIVEMGDNGVTLAHVEIAG